MLWKALIPWAVLCLAGFVVGEDYDFIYWYPGRRKLASIDLDESVDEEDKLISNDVGDTTNRTRHRQADDSSYRAEFPEPENGDKKRKMSLQSLENPNPFLLNYLSFTKLNLYNRFKKVQVVEASRWFKNYDYSKDLVVLVHGANSQPNYVEDFFSAMAFALLSNGDYNVIGIDWRYFYTKENNIFDTERNLEELEKIGHVLQSVVERARHHKYPNIIKTIYIGHGLGNVPVVVQSATYGYVFDVIYGLAPRFTFGSHNNYMLTQLHGRLVNILTTVSNPYSLGHRNFYTLYDDGFIFKGNHDTLAYQVLSKAVLYGNITARYCESAEAYNLGYCSGLTEIPLWSREMHPDKRIPDGKYFLELPSPKLRRACSTQVFFVMEHI